MITAKAKFENSRLISKLETLQKEKIYLLYGILDFYLNMSFRYVIKMCNQTDNYKENQYGICCFKTTPIKKHYSYAAMLGIVLKIYTISTTKDS